MRLYDALKINQSPPGSEAPVFRAFLVCGFTALHLQTFLKAHLRQRMPGSRVEIESGLYGDLLGNLERLRKAQPDAAVVVLEWADLDPRLGLRSLGGWNQEGFLEIPASVRTRLDAIREAVEAIAALAPAVVSLPSLPLLPLSPNSAAWSSNSLEFQLREALSGFAGQLAAHPNIRIVSADWLERTSPVEGRFDAKSELSNGFPYTLPHASALSDLLATLLCPPAPRKGLITDLDNTLWKGILGELGPSNVAWDLDRKGHVHAIYQEFLRSLARSGVLIGVASKNDLALVEQAFARPDMILAKGDCYPLEVHWGHKSQSVERILKTWNIAGDSVVFVDDSPAELAEVQAAHPGVVCLRFPDDSHGLYDFLAGLRNLFAKPVTTEEDRLRLESIRRNGEIPSAGMPAAVSDNFLAQAESVLTLSLDKTWDPRALELLNKTNQFNLNGQRYAEAAWRRRLGEENFFVLKVSYRDKFGPLGKIAVLCGRVSGNRLAAEAWVMSCRAFSRRIEHACLQYLFQAFDAEAIDFKFIPTERNGPLQEFFAGLLGESPQPELTLTRNQFAESCPRLAHRVEEEVYG